MLLNREEFLMKLEAVQAGLTYKQVLEQSSCVVFKDKKMITFNDEVACLCDSGVDFTGAVEAVPLLAILRKLKGDDVTIERDGNELLIKSGRITSGITMDAEVTLPYHEKIKPPKEWKKLDPEFSEAVEMVYQCAGKDQSKFHTTCVHVAPKWIEACDGYQVIRYTLKTKFSKNAMFRRESIKHITALGMTEFGETETWTHFRNPTGVILACRRYPDEFDDVSGFLNVTGKKVILPKRLADSVELAEVFSSENADANMVKVILKPGKLIVKSEGVTGWFSEPMKVTYKGPILKFMIPPKLLAEITQRHNECEMTKNRLKVDGGSFVYVACLEPATANEGK